MKVRILKNQDGTVSVIYPAIKSRRANESESEWLTRVFDRATPNGALYEDVEENSLPDRYYREQWRAKESGGVYIPAELKAIKDNEVLAEEERVNSLKTWDNKYISLARELGLPDKATTEDIEAKLGVMEEQAMAEGNIAGALNAIKIGVRFLAIINAITQSGGKHEGIKWHEDV